MGTMTRVRLAIQWIDRRIEATLHARLGYTSLVGWWFQAGILLPRISPKPRRRGFATAGSGYPPFQVNPDRRT